MSLKVIKSVESSFQYNPKTKSLCIISDLKFILNNISMEFEIDQNPNGEPRTVAINDLRLYNNDSELDFECVYRRKRIKYNLQSKYKIDSIIYNYIVRHHSELNAPDLNASTV
jgi:hypothetical protein